MGNDDRQIGTILSRREAIASMGVAGAAFMAGSHSLSSLIAKSGPRATQLDVPACVVRPAQEEGPYFVDEKLNRSDIRSDPGTGILSAGTPLKLAFRIAQVGTAGCIPAKGVLVDVWHCDANGVYSDEEAMNGQFNSRGKKFLRGYQVTDASGHATFQTIYPGWYEGRAVHIHFKLRTAPGSSNGREFTSQLYFEEALNTKVHAAMPYAAKGAGRLLNADDRIFQEGGKQLTLDAVGGAGGYSAVFEVGMAK